MSILGVGQSFGAAEWKTTLPVWARLLCSRDFQAREAAEHAVVSDIAVTRQLRIARKKILGDRLKPHSRRQSVLHHISFSLPTELLCVVVVYCGNDSSPLE